MYLKSLEIYGFKSFADRVEFNFPNGIIAVVGPNGSGKSNIVDAIRWVLGEQSIKTLRGSKLEDVIFSGTVKRKPLGYAEVSLTLDNSNRFLPLDYEEINIMRRTYRSGESEFYINKKPCRLKDIIELFMDTGVGKEGYCIIGQGKVDEIIHSKPIERRVLLEEAAGILKYKSRKEEAEAKLREAEQNLLRLKDIIGELEIQLDPLKEQAEKAKRYINLVNELKELEVCYFIEKMDKLNLEIGMLNNRLELLSKNINIESKKLENIERLKINLEEKLKELIFNIEELKNNCHNEKNKIEKIKGEINVLKEREANLSNNSKKLEEAVQEYNSVIKSIEDNLNFKKQEYIGVLEIIRAKESDLKRKEQELSRSVNLMEEEDKKIERLKEDIVEILNEISSKKSSIKSLLNFKEGLFGKIKKIDEELGQLENRKIKLCEIKENYKKEREIFLTNLDINEKEVIGLKDSRDKYEKKLQKLESDLKVFIEQKNNLTSRLSILEEMERSYEGFNKGVRSVLKIVKQDSQRYKGVLGLVADLFEVEKKFETALEVALGSSIQNIVTETEEEAKEIIGILKSQNLGRATFLPLNCITAKGLHDAIKNEKGFLGYANKLIKYEERFEALFSYLLGRVLVVDVLDNAILLSKKYDFQYKIVTLEGELLLPGGSITGGSLGQGMGLLKRRREIREIKSRIALLDNEILMLRNSIDVIYKELSGLKRNMEIKLREQEFLKSGLEEINAKILKTSSEIDGITFEINVKINEKNSANKEIENISKNIEGMSSEINNLNEVYEKIKDDLEKTKKNDLEIEKKVAALRNEITEEKVVLAKLQQELLDKEKEINGLKVNLTQVLNKKSDIFKELQESKNECQNIIEILKEKSFVLSESTRILEELESSIKKCNVEKEDLEKKLLNKNSAINNLKESLNILNREFYQIDNKLSRYLTEYNSIKEILWEKYEITIEEASKIREKNKNLEPRLTDINNLKSRIKELEPVNIMAIEEYDKLKERYDFLVLQKSDLEKAKESLYQIIEEMESKAKKRFQEFFEDLRVEFQNYFVKLFNGGKADLVLTEKEDILNSGIDIMAQPPGKKLQNIALLSGGEKALTAISLLFAILSLKPTPFCIFDEIEAALDDINIYRFTNLLRELSNKVQFILITHRKNTMEVADVLYGITMEETGVSKVISVKLEEKTG